MIAPSLLAGGLIGMGLLVALRVAVQPPMPHLGRRHIELYEPPPGGELPGLDRAVEQVRPRAKALRLREQTLVHRRVPVDTFRTARKIRGRRSKQNDLS